MPKPTKKAPVRRCSACGKPIKTKILRQCERCVVERRGV